MSRTHRNSRDSDRERLRMKLRKTYNDKYRVMDTDSCSSSFTSESTPEKPQHTTDTRNIQDLLNYIDDKDHRNSFEKYVEDQRKQNELDRQRAEENEKLLGVQKRLSKKIGRLERQMQTEIVKEKERQYQESLRMAELERKINEIKILEEQNHIKLEEQQSKNAKKKEKASEKPKSQDFNATVNSKQVHSLTDIVSHNENSAGKLVTIKRVKCTTNETTVNVTFKPSVHSEEEESYTFVDGKAAKNGENASNSNKEEAANKQRPPTSTPNFPFTYQAFPNLPRSPIPCFSPSSTPLKSNTHLNNSQNMDNYYPPTPESTHSIGSIQLSPEITVTKVYKSTEIRRSTIDPINVSITKIDSPNKKTTELSPRRNQPPLTETQPGSGVYFIDKAKVKQGLPNIGSKKNDKRKQKFQVRNETDK